MDNNLLMIDIYINNLTFRIFNIYTTNLCRTKHPTLKRYIWLKKIKQARLDYFICSNTMLDLVTDCNIKPGYWSDHSSVELKIKLNKIIRGKGVWKLNRSLLKDPDYLTLINKTIDKETIN